MRILELFSPARRAAREAAERTAAEEAELDKLRQRRSSLVWQCKDFVRKTSDWPEYAVHEYGWVPPNDANINEMDGAALEALEKKLEEATRVAKGVSDERNSRQQGQSANHVYRLTRRGGRGALNYELSRSASSIEAKFRPAMTLADILYWWGYINSQDRESVWLGQLSRPEATKRLNGQSPDRVWQTAPEILDQQELLSWGAPIYESYTISTVQELIDAALKKNPHGRRLNRLYDEFATLGVLRKR